MLTRLYAEDLNGSRHYLVASKYSLKEGFLNYKTPLGYEGYIPDIIKLRSMEAMEKDPNSNRARYH